MTKQKGVASIVKYGKQELGVEELNILGIEELTGTEVKGN